MIPKKKVFIKRGKGVGTQTSSSFLPSKLRFASSCINDINGYFTQYYIDDEHENSPSFLREDVPHHYNEGNVTYPVSHENIEGVQ